MQASTNLYKKFLPSSIVLHAVILFVLFGSITFTTGAMFSAEETAEPVKAMVVDEKEVAEQVKAIEKAEAKEKQKKLDDAWRLHVQNKKLKQEIAAQENKLAQMKAAVEKQKKDDAKKKQLAQEQAEKAAKQRELEAKKAAEAEKIAAAKKAEEEKKLAAAKEAALAKKAADEKAARFASEVEKYKSMIVSAIEKEWLVPSSADSHMSAKLLIELGPEGAVTNVQILESSQNPALDRSAISAVYKASPLPVPEDRLALDQFRSFSLTVTPKDIV